MIYNFLKISKLKKNLDSAELSTLSTSNINVIQFSGVHFSSCVELLHPALQYCAAAVVWPTFNFGIINGHLFGEKVI